jgi:hypothetical protein
MTYKPKPINTDHIILSADIMQLVEQLAENTHDIWALQRINEGWTYGGHRDDQLKQHSCLVPYNELPENEKQYDRNTAMGTLKMIAFLGYSIKK